jgi:hypothetical protein
VPRTGPPVGPRRVRSAGQRTGETTVKDASGELNERPLPGATSSTVSGRNGREADLSRMLVGVPLLAIRESGGGPLSRRKQTYHRRLGPGHQGDGRAGCRGAALPRDRGAGGRRSRRFGSCGTSAGPDLGTQPGEGGATRRAGWRGGGADGIGGRGSRPGQAAHGNRRLRQPTEPLDGAAGGSCGKRRTPFLGLPRPAKRASARAGSMAEPR